MHGILIASYLHLKSISRWMHFFKIHMIYTYTIYTICINTLNPFHHTKHTSSCFACNRANLPSLQAESLCLCTMRCHQYTQTTQILHINRRTLACTRGGGGVPARLRSFYIIITPHVTFFAILPPLVGRCLRLVTMWGHTHHTIIPPCKSYPHAPHAPHSMASFPRVCVCRVVVVQLVDMECGT